MNNKLIPKEDYKIEITSENGVLTVRSLDPNSPSNSNILGEFVSNSSTENLFDENNLPMITTLQELLSNLSEVLIRFDTNPKYYQKGDFEQLIKTVTESLIFLYTKFQLNQNIQFIGIANVNTDPIKDSIDLNFRFPGIYLINTSGEYINFGFSISEEQIKNSVILALPIIQEGVFNEYEVIVYSLNIPTKLSEFENDSNFATREEVPNKLSDLVNNLDHNDSNNIQGGLEGERYHLTLTQLNKVNNSQEQLISGTNIKTINGNSLLGNGNLWIGENPQFKVTFTRDNIIWTDDWMTILSSEDVYNRDITVYKLEVQTGDGIVQLNPIIAYPYALVNGYAAERKFFIKDTLGKLSRSLDFEYVYIEYSISEIIPDQYNFDTRNQIGENVIQEENAGEYSHSSNMKKVFMACYPELWQTYNIQSFESILDPLANNGSISAAFEPKYAELKKANLFLRPYVNGASSEQLGSNPNILKVGSHYGNWGHFLPENQEIDITPADDIFLSHVIAVAARGDYEEANREYVPNISGLVGRYGWTKDGWVGDFESGFTHEIGNTSPLSRLCYIKWSPTESRKYWVDFTVTGRTTGSFTISLNSQTSSAYTSSGRFELITSSLDNKVITITPTSDFNGTIKVKCNLVLNQSSYGRGLEFSEDFNEGEIMDTPLADDWVAYAMVCTNGDGSIIQATVDSSGNPYNPDWTNKFEVGDIIQIRTTSTITAEVAEVLGVNSIRLVNPITPISNASGNPYIWKFSTGRTLHDIAGYGQQQSPTCSIVGAKLKKIKLMSGANWQIVREAARMTAKKTVNGVFGNHPGHWDKYRGFGQIYPDDAVQWIKDNYTENTEYLESLISDADRVHGINPILKYEHISNNTPITKRMVSEITENNYTDIDKSKLDSYPELLIETENKLIADTGDFIPIPVAAGGANAQLYFSNQISDISGVKTLSYTADVNEIQLSGTITNTEGIKLLGSFIYPAGVASTIYPAGQFAFNLFGNVSQTSGNTYIGARYFKYSSLGVKTYIFDSIVWSLPIKSTENHLIQIVYNTTSSTSTELSDRMGCDLFLKRDNTGSRTVTIVLGDGNASYLNNPNLLRHDQTRNINGNPGYQHIDTTISKTTPIDADSLALLDSVTGKFVKVSLEDLYDYIIAKMGE